jgi:hypothetical protein
MNDDPAADALNDHPLPTSPNAAPRPPSRKPYASPVIEHTGALEAVTLATGVLESGIDCTP